MSLLSQVYSAYGQNIFNSVHEIINNQFLFLFSYLLHLPNNSENWIRSKMKYLHLFFFTDFHRETCDICWLSMGPFSGCEQ